MWKNENIRKIRKKQYYKHVLNRFLTTFPQSYPQFVDNIILYFKKSEVFLDFTVIFS